MEEFRREGGRREGIRGRREGNEEIYRHNYIHGCGLNPLWKYLMQGVLCQFCTKCEGDIGKLAMEVSLTEMNKG